MDNQDKHRFVQQYVERQKAYLPTYTTEHLLNERHGTPAKPLRSDEFGFDTPVLRPRVPENKTSRCQPALSRTQEAELSKQGPPEEASETRDPALGKKNKPGSKRRKASTPVDTDNECAARLADRRERKRKKRAIVNPPQKHGNDIAPTTAPKTGRTNGQKAKKPAALALLYGFSATNVTKDRLTLKPAPSLGVFSKGRASAKKKVTATRKSSSKNELFSECAFLNKQSERSADHSRIEDDSDSSVHITNRTETSALKVPQASARTTAESEVWDIELQSKLPSSAQDVSSESGANDGAPVVLDLRGAQWSASVKVAEERRRKAQLRSLSVTQSLPHSVVSRSPLARSDLDDLPHAADVPSIHPSHSASQVGRRPPDPHPVTSPYFTEPEPVTVQELAATGRRPSDLHLYATDSELVSVQETPRSNDGLDQDELDVQVRAASPVSSLTSAALPMVEFQTRYDMVPPEFSSDCSWYDEHVPLEPRYFELESCVETSISGLGDDVESASMEDWYDPLAPAVEDVPHFLEGRALLLGISEGPGLSGLAQAEMDVASGLRNHWRPLRLS